MVRATCRQLPRRGRPSERLESACRIRQMFLDVRDARGGQPNDRPSKREAALCRFYESISFPNPSARSGFLRKSASKSAKARKLLSSVRADPEKQPCSAASTFWKGRRAVRLKSMASRSDEP